MNQYIARNAIVGGFIVFVWSMVSWMLLPWHLTCMQKFTNEVAVQEVIRENAPVVGVYVLPNYFSETASEQMDEEKAMRNGPVLFGSVGLNQSNEMSSAPIIISLMTQIFGAGIIAWLLKQTKLRAYASQVLFITVIGFLIGLLGALPSWTWCGYPVCYVLPIWADYVIGWWLAGPAMAKLSVR